MSGTGVLRHGRGRDGVDKCVGSRTQPGMDCSLQDVPWNATWMHGDDTVDARGSVGGQRAWGEVDCDGTHAYVWGRACLVEC